MTDEPKGKTRAQDAKPAEEAQADSTKDQPTEPGDAAAATQDEAEDLAEAAAPAGHPPVVAVPQVSPEAAPRPKRKGKKGDTALLVYAGPADVFTAADGTKFRPGVPTAIGGEHVDELLTYPSHSFREANEAEADEAKEQEQDDGR